MLRVELAWLGCAAVIAGCDGSSAPHDFIAQRPGDLGETRDHVPSAGLPEHEHDVPDDFDDPRTEAERCAVRFGSTQSVVMINGKVIRDVRSSSCASQVQGSGKLRSERRTFPDFTALRISGGLRVEVARGEPALDLLLDDNLLEHVVSELRDGALTLRVRDDETQLLPSDAARIIVHAPDLTLIETRDATSLRGTVSGGVLTARALEASLQELAIQSADTLRVDVSGASRLSLSGSASVLDITASGAARIVGSAGARVSVAASGAAQVELRATQALRATASGTAQVTVLGSPSGRDVRTAELGTVRFVE